MPKKHYLTIAAAAMLGLSGFSTAFAGTETATTEGKATTPPAPAVTPGSYITGDFGVTFVSEYDSRGIPQPDQWKGVIAQPYLDLYIKLYSGDANSMFINSVSAQLSFWSDVGSNTDTAAANTIPAYLKAAGVSKTVVKPLHNALQGSARDWEEFDWDPGVSVTFAQKFTLLAQYFEFDSPAGAFPTTRSIDANLTYDDSWLLGAFSLHPHATVLYELGAPGYAGLQPKGWYYEFGIAPSYTLLPKSNYPITIAIPNTLGLGDDHGFYGNNTFGYYSVGPSISVPLAFIPAGFGSWTVTAAYTYYYLGTTIREANFAAGGSGANSRNVFSGALGCTF
jgi:hypothetical protein